MARQHFPRVRLHVRCGRDSNIRAMGYDGCCSHYRVLDTCKGTGLPVGSLRALRRPRYRSLAFASHVYAAVACCNAQISKLTTRSSLDELLSEPCEKFIEG